MALATRPKPKIHHKKRQAEHHSHGKHYLKTYWPYLPMLAIVGVGALVNNLLYSSASLSRASATIYGNHVALSRVQSITGDNSSMVYLGALAITLLAFCYLLYTHYFRFHKVIIKGENYLIAHPYADISVITLCTIGFILTRGGSLIIS
jgi:uncharacterized membrane protein